MKKSSIAASLILLACLPLSGQAMAACTGPSLNHERLGTALRGNTVCAVRGGERWQEYHAASGQLIDYKEGPSDPVDPSEQVGNWSIVGTGTNAMVSYNYGAGGAYSYTVYSNGGNSYSFCNGGAEMLVSVSAGQVPCP